VTGLGRALLAALDDGDLAELASRLAPFLPAPPTTDDRWFTSSEAAEHLGLSLNALHKLTAARTIPFEQKTPGCKCWFRRSDLDRWRDGRAAHSDHERAAGGERGRRR
jgi:excisionase family DNA binding protein